MGQVIKHIYDATAKPYDIAMEDGVEVIRPLTPEGGMYCDFCSVSHVVKEEDGFTLTHEDVQANPEAYFAAVWATVPPGIKMVPGAEDRIRDNCIGLATKGKYDLDDTTEILQHGDWFVCAEAHKRFQNAKFNLPSKS